MQSKRVFITGAAGLLGSSLVPFLSSLGHQVHSFTRSQYPSVDLTDALAAKTLLDKIYPDVVVNLAALTNVDLCEKTPTEAYLSNTKLVESLAEWSLKNGVHIIHISTDMVYSKEGLNKEHDVLPMNYYGYSKYCGELHALIANGTILRTNFFGKSNLPSKSSFSDWLRTSFQKKDALKLFQDVFFTPLHIDTLCSMIDLCIEKKNAGIFNLGSKEGLSKAGFAQYYAKLLNHPIEEHSKLVSIKDVSLIAPRPQHMQMDVSKFEQTFNVKLPTLKQEIEKLLE